MNLPPNHAPGPQSGSVPYPRTPDAVPPKTLAEQNRPLDIILAFLFYAGMIAISGFTLLMVLLGPTLTASCFDDCDMGAFNWAWGAMVWSMPIAFLVVTVGIVWSAVTRRFMLFWPLGGCVALGVATWVSMGLMESATVG